MADGERAQLTAILAELCQAVAADGGAALYLDDAQGTLQLAASTISDRGRQRGLLKLLRSRLDDDGRTLVVPLSGSSGGVIVLSRRTGAEFTQQDRAVARLYARRFSDDSVASGAQVSRSGWLRQLEAIQRIAARLTRLASVEEVGATVCSETGEVFGHDEAHVLLVDEGGHVQTVAASGFEAGTFKPLPSEGLAAEALARAFDAGVPVLVAEAADLGADRPGAHSLLIAPLHYESRVTGVICFIARGSRRFDDDDVRLLQILSDQAAVAIENARLLHGRDQLVLELSGLLEISQLAGAATDATALASLLAARLRAVIGADAAVVSRWDEESTTMRVICRDGVGGTSSTIDVADSAARRQVLRTGRPVIIQADTDDALVEAEQLRQIGAHTLFLQPLNAGGRTIGMVELLATRGRRLPTPAEMQACDAMASLAATGLERIHVLEQLRSAADMDLVSGVHNHRFLQERLRQELARSARAHSPMAVLMLDLDKFKPINDRHGHADGDRVLHSIAATVKAHVRESDIVARYGGDEFVVLMPDTSVEQAEHVARRVVSGVLRQRHRVSDGSQVTVGVSAGLAVYPNDARTAAQLLQAADAAMYSAKRAGRHGLERPGAPLVPDIGEPVAARASVTPSPA